MFVVRTATGDERLASVGSVLRLFRHNEDRCRDRVDTGVEVRPAGWPRAYAVPDASAWRRVGASLRPGVELPRALVAPEGLVAVVVARHGLDPTRSS